ncbi:hypothetical protein [Bacillus haynesii]|uniref:hypothetical protein n=1 Tax=Bacillus haynesii TaxID=1925021 RepID=UPI00228292EB|nr:hypothetical protein [Bacillus haynesii]MCY8076773.1 hypothetical protein [Bacillus haynesii]
MVNKLFNEGIIYAVNSPSKLLRELEYLINLLEKQKIIATVNILDNQKNYFKSINKDIENDIQIYFSNNLLWFFVNDIYECSQILKKIELELKKYISKIYVTDKFFIQSVFRNKFSDNLLEINVGGEDLLEFEEETLTGSFINKSFVYRDVMEFKDIHIRYVKLQPLNLNAVLSLRYPNIVEFSDYIDGKMHLKLIKDFSLHVYDSNKNIIHFKKEKKNEEYNNNSKY